MVAAAFAAFVLYPGVLAIVEPAAASQNADSIAFVFVGAALAAQFIGLPLSLIAWAVAGRRRSEPTPADPNPITWPRPPVR